ncbi:a7dc0336-fb66-4118-84e1-a7f1730d0624 [Sclerotinia trifoliorum]|uniref:U6 snRNA phosphodiesterase n=1 Tax=Sclerotinia trifoliorum TaxID=28548 RepID=A0A8H2VNJ1_9HELO|nr:a7dc0336-fb66-4118-84e1-a7f1730d0624 [Sclerotinia trifoliorum]
MALVDYPSSDEDDVGDDVDQVHQHNEEDEKTTTTKTSNSNNLKRKRSISRSSKLPPLPSKFHDLYASTVRNSTRDDPGLHGGRKRVIPHIEGNWPTHIYIEWYPSTIEFSSLSSLILKVVSLKRFEIQSFLTSDLGVPLPLHVSLSRAIGFSKDVKDSFLNSFEQAIKSSGIRPFEIGFSGLSWVPNYEKTRWFLVLRLNIPESNALNKLLHVSNKVVEEFGQPPLYADSRASENDTKIAHPSKRDAKNFKEKTRQKEESFVNMVDLSKAFHISIAWTLLPPDQELIEATEQLTSKELMKVQEIQIQTKEIKAKIGNVVTNLPLPVGITEGKNLFGF